MPAGAVAAILWLWEANLKFKANIPRQAEQDPENLGPEELS